MKHLFENWKTFLEEGRFESATTDITRKIIPHVKRVIIGEVLPKYKDKEIKDPYKRIPVIPMRFTKRMLPKELHSELYELVAKFYIEPNMFERTGKTFGIGGGYAREEHDREFSNLILLSYFSKEFSEKDLSEYLGELKSALIHELQHVGQTDDILQTSPLSAQFGQFDFIEDIRGYYNSEAEIDAKTKELYKKAKYFKKPFSDVLDEELEGLFDAFLRRTQKFDQVEYTEDEIRNFFFVELKNSIISKAEKNYPKVQLI